MRNELATLAAIMSCLAAAPAAAETLYAHDFERVSAYDTTTRPNNFSLRIGEAMLASPRSPAIGADGHLYLFDRGAEFNKSEVHEFTAEGDYVGLFNANAGLSQPEKMIAGPGGDLFVVTATGNPPGVYRIDGATGVNEGVYTVGLSLNFPFGLAFDSMGRLYVSDTGLNTAFIHRYDATGMFDTTVVVHKSIKPADLISHPRGLCMGEDGMLYIVEHFDDAVLRYDPETDTVEHYADAIDSPQDCAIGADGTIYVDVAGDDAGILPIAPPVGEGPATPGETFGHDLLGHRTLALGPVTLDVTTTSSTTTTLAAEVCGDATEDGSITASDALKVLRAAVGPVVCPLNRCDPDDSGTITASDALRVLRRAVGNNVSMNCPT